MIFIQKNQKKQLLLNASFAFHSVLLSVTNMQAKPWADLLGFRQNPARIGHCKILTEKKIAVKSTEPVETNLPV